jgi:hypothetical protein
MLELSAVRLARVAVSSLIVLTLWSQHPHPAFNRVRLKDNLSLIPNWRFFAPVPAQHDYHVYYRALDTDGGVSEWKPVHTITPRRNSQFVWFPSRRREKGLFDIVSELLPLLDSLGPRAVQNAPAYRLLENTLRWSIPGWEQSTTVDGFQFALIRHTGYELSTDPDIIFASPYSPIELRSGVRTAGPRRKENHDIGQ